jgi:hypothetical protein
LDSFDLVEGLVIQDGPQVEVLNGVSLHGGLVESWPHATIMANFVVDALVAHWRAVGLPDYAQFDNDPLFEGPQIHPDWQHRLVRAEVDLKEQRIRFYRLRRRAPAQQPLAQEVPYMLPRRKFSE